MQITNNLIMMAIKVLTEEIDVYILYMLDKLNEQQVGLLASYSGCNCRKVDMGEWLLTGDSGSLSSWRVKWL